jgi:predicted SAM-dependent methyltransferase
MFRTDSVDLVYACHCLEHFPIAAVPRVLREWRRVLRPGGTLRLSVPDFDALVDGYLAGGRDVGTVEYPLLGGQSDRRDFHRAVFNRRRLTSLLEGAGFVGVAGWEPGASRLTTFDDWSGRTLDLGGGPRRVSLNLEARK